MHACRMFGLNAKGIGWIALVWELDFDVHPQILQRTIRDSITYRGHPTAIKEELP